MKRHSPVQHAFFFALLLITTYVFYGLVREFFMPLFWAAVLAILFHPVRRFWLVRLRNRYSLAAFLTVLTVLLTVILPLVGVTVAVTNEATNLYERIQSGEIDPRAPLTYAEQMLPQATEFLRGFGIDVQQVNENLRNFAVTASRYLATQAVAIGQSALTFAVLFFLMLYLLFFFVRDGHKIMDAVIEVLPLGEERERRLLAKFTEVSRATIKGTLTVGAVQGVLGGLIFWILGITAPVFWGVLMTFFSLLPAVGPAIIWVPAAVILILTGSLVKGIILIVFGVVVIGLVDNILRPILVGRDTQMPDYLILLSTLGGITVFGISGFVIGPVIAALFLVLWDMFREEYSQDDDVESVKQAAEHPKTVTDAPAPPKDALSEPDPTPAS